ncbi:MAG TPA: Kdo hydroxylase family protein [Acidobacteriaceae bacterium]|nr:Kdo hydroxylase family protein [Acidobacteriaceae bacterium]
MGVVTIPFQATDEGDPSSTDQALFWCRQLEEGNILLFPHTPIALANDDLRFILGLEQNGSALHKNFAYKVATDSISGANMKSSDPAARERLRGILRSYSQHVAQFLTGFLSPYQVRWQLDYASFRSQEEQGRDLPLRKRNDLMHTDAFPTRPTHGARILRFFNNIHPTRTRDWITGEPFRALLPQFAPKKIALPHAEGALTKLSRNVACSVGLGRAIPALKRSPYDRFMMRFHDFLKENAAYQAQGMREASYFPPGSSWMVYTDMVPHAVLAGQYALEQTFLVAPEAMVAPEHAPLGVLEALAGQKLV